MMTANEVRALTVSDFVDYGHPNANELGMVRILMSDQAPAYRNMPGIFAYNLDQVNFQSLNQLGRALRVIQDFNIRLLGYHEVQDLANPNLPSSRVFRTTDTVYHFQHLRRNEEKLVIMRGGQMIPVYVENQLKNDGISIRSYREHPIIFSNQRQIAEWNLKARENNAKEGTTWPTYDPKSIIGLDKYSMAVLLDRWMTIVVPAPRWNISGTNEDDTTWRNRVFQQKTFHITKGYQNETAQDEQMHFQDFQS